MRASQLQTPGIALSDPLGVRPRYCACHDPVTGQPSSEGLCKTTLCPTHGVDADINLFTDTGYQTLIWKDVDGVASCSLKDVDGNGRANECPDAIVFRRFRRVYRHHGTPLCTKRGEQGCQPADGDAFWLRDSNTNSFTWDWRAQDYPNSSGSYDPSTTQSKYVRVWLHAENSLDNTYANSYSEPQVLAHELRLVVSRPIYDKKIYRWWLAAPVDPWGPTTILTPVPRDESALPDGWAWLDGIATAATRVLASTDFDPVGGAMASTRPGVFYGDPHQAFDTAGIGACRLDEATFAFGGENGDRELSGGLWFGFSEGSSQFWQPVGGSLGLAGMSAPAPAPAGVSSSKTPAPKITFASWLAGLRTKVGKSRPALALLAAQKQAAFDAAMAARPPWTSQPPSPRWGPRARSPRALLAPRVSCPQGLLCWRWPRGASPQVRRFRRSTRRSWRTGTS